MSLVRPTSITTCEYLYEIPPRVVGVDLWPQYDRKDTRHEIYLIMPQSNKPENPRSEPINQLNCMVGKKRKVNQANDKSQQRLSRVVNWLSNFMDFGVAQQLEAVYLILSFLVEDRYMQIAFRRLSKKGFGNSWLKLKSAWQVQSMY